MRSWRGSGEEPVALLCEHDVSVIAALLGVLKESEAALRKLDAIKDVVVVGRRDGHGEQQLVAYIVPAKDAPTVSALRHVLAHVTRVSYAVDIRPDVSIAADTEWEGRHLALPAPGKTRPALPVP
jgi:hypothetical protein